MKKLIRCKRLTDPKPIWDDQCPVKAGRLKFNKECQSCSLFESPKPNLKPKKDKLLEPVNKKVEIKGKMIYSHPKSIAGSQEAFKEHYKEDNNTQHLMLAFNHAVENGIPIPQWVIDRVYEAFNCYMDDNNNPSLDVLLGCKKRGPWTVKERFKQRGKKVDLMTAMDILKRQGIRVVDAAVVAHEYIHNRGSYVPNPEKVRTMYYSEWKKKLQKICEYPQDMIEAVLQSAPEEIQRKYPRIFDQLSSPIRKKAGQCPNLC